jgi:hypothetical protein
MTCIIRPLAVRKSRPRAVSEGVENHESDIIDSAALFEMQGREAQRALVYHL